MKTDTEKKRELRIKIQTIKQIIDSLKGEYDFYSDLLSTLEKAQK